VEEDSAPVVQPGEAALNNPAVAILAVSRRAWQNDWRNGHHRPETVVQFGARPR
jgi:hypothetical protein